MKKERRVYFSVNGINYYAKEGEARKYMGDAAVNALLKGPPKLPKKSK